MDIKPAGPYPLGVFQTGSGAVFSLFSKHAERVELCLFEAADAREESRRFELSGPQADIWRCSVAEISPGQLYGYRVYGPYQPEQGHRFNPHKVLLDPYGRGIGRPPSWHPAWSGDAAGGRMMNSEDSAACSPLSRVVDDRFDWASDRPPRTPWERTLIYEVHVKGFSALHPGVPSKLRGCYRGLGSEAALEHLTSLGVTAVELMPVHQGIEEAPLLSRGLVNYWGYNTLCYFAPDIRFCPPGSEPVHEFKEMVKALHAAGIEVILDVVFNHTAESSELGPTLSFRGIDNASYYRLRAEDKRRYENFAGCGNTLNTGEPRVLQLIMDSLRYWVQDMHVDGFRFDLAPALCRDDRDFDSGAAFLDIILQDPVLSQVKLIAEPWDLGEGGYRLGGFPPIWREWNDRYRSAVRSYWRGEKGTVGRMASALAGSSDVFQQSRRGPTASINYVACHDGFTLSDLVSYSEKHNELNKEGNQDGENFNISFNCGVEGPTSDPEVTALRTKQRCNIIATLLLSAGVPMLLGGDELGRTQQGNNNAYCQDNELTWFDWTEDEARRKFLDFVKRVIQIRQGSPAFQRQTFFTGRLSECSPLKDVAWYTDAGTEITGDQWANPDLQQFAALFSGTDPETGWKGGPQLMIFNSSARLCRFVLPRTAGKIWKVLLDTADPPQTEQVTGHFMAAPVSLALLQARTGGD